MRRGWIFAALAITLLLACSHEEKVETPEVLLTEQQMVDLLTDSYLIEAIVNQRRSTGEEVTPLQVAYYDQLFEHYGIDDSVFVANMNYYTHEPPILERIMDSVHNRFLKAQQE